MKWTKQWVAVSVDPQECEENWHKAWPRDVKILCRSGKPEIDGEKYANGYFIDVYGDSGGVEVFVLSPQESYELAIHLLSHAAARGVNTLLPVAVHQAEGTP